MLESLNPLHPVAHLAWAAKDRSLSMSDAAAHLPPILRRLHLLRGSAGVASGRVIDYILHSPERFLGLTIAEISDRTQTSDATVVRLVQSMGFGGFQEFKLQLSRSLALSRNTDLTVEAGDFEDGGAPKSL